MKQKKISRSIKIVYLSIFVFIIFLKLPPIKVCLCTIGKLENLYVREFVSHYKSYGVDKIFIYDNNNINDERFETVINDYIRIGFVMIIDYRGKEKQQLKAYQDCLNKNYKEFSWIIFYDMDEFIHLKNFNNIKDYLNQPKFIKCQSIQLNMFFHNDNDLLYYDNRSLFQRFIKKIKRPIEPVKSIIKGNIKINISCVHNLNISLKSCNGFGKYNKKEKNNILTKNPDFDSYYLDHFCFKSTEEFVNKINRGSAFYGKEDSTKMVKIGWYFERNNRTERKISFMEKYTRLNLSQYRNEITNNTFR